MSDEISGLKESEKELFTEERADHRVRRHGDNNWVGGVVLIGIGVIFLFSNIFDTFYFHNWWALFIMIPAISNFSTAWRKYNRDGSFTRPVRSSLTGGVIMTLIASAFLFNLDWGLIWPLFLIIGGLSALMGGWFD